MLSSLLPSKATACPYCYAELNVNKVAFRCSGRGAPGRTPCKPVPDPKRGEAFSDGTPVLPAISEPGQQRDLLGKSTASCGNCGGESGIRMCPSCHSILPRGLDNNSPLFGLIGVRNSGKTVLLSVLHRELVQSVARRFDAAIDTPGGSTGLARDLAQYEKDMAREGGSLPRQTPASGTVKKTPAVYEWKYARKGKTASTIFSFYDTAGEDVSRQETAMMQQYLGQASGVILLLDPFAFPENHERAEQLGAAASDSDTPESALDGITFVLQSAHNVKRNKKIKVPLAVVVSKIDAFFDQIPASHPLRQPSSGSGSFDDDESRTIHDHVMALVANWGGDGLLRKLDLEYDNFRLFGVSALGAEPDYRSGSVSSRGVLPHRVADPLLWLMADRGFIPKSDG
ncbi:TRAFAC clade GTPase domain-containing protein [Arthrobacter zhaoxinii]|uniref:TRAFAC clade GTPase domain-containing protein n=1 Tax=Arthrobacter zhaoxinii TaxID=2964616 RepID=UPI0021067966|nr:hypothetical protein [Arthrobacter zhaoxinii]MCQ2001131.1 hypothetical protein [Arthrobacter zhaoxinii]